jgi:hypothetical protein
MLMLMAEENNSDIPSPSMPNDQALTSLGANPVTVPSVVPPPPSQPSVATSPVITPKPKRKYLVFVLIGLAILIFAGSVYGAYRVGKGHQKVITVAPTPKPLSLPPQAVVIEECVIGRGKQYILPKDIPGGPIYDVVNNKVVALEYSLNVTSIQSNPEYLSEAILRLTRDYPVDHFSVAPVTPKQGQPVSDFHIIMFIVSKDESAKITCKNGPA